MGVAYAVNHFQRKKKQCNASTVTDLISSVNQRQNTLSTKLLFRENSQKRFISVSIFHWKSNIVEKLLTSGNDSVDSPIP